MLAAAYDFLRTTQPFCAWRLPHSGELGFAVIRDRTIYADFGMENSMPMIGVSAAKNGHTATLVATMAQKMLHLRQEMTGDRGQHATRFSPQRRACLPHPWLRPQGV